MFPIFEGKAFSYLDINIQKHIYTNIHIYMQRFINNTIIEWYAQIFPNELELAT